MRIILASNSPRRKQLLEQFGYKFEVIKSDYDEKSLRPTSPIKMVKQLAFGKANCVYNNVNSEDVIVLGADTIVVFKGKIIGKPKDKEDAKNTLRNLSNHSHFVYTGFALISKDKTTIKCVKSKVYFNKLSNEMISQYVESGLPLDKAGSYGIQDEYNVVKGYKGSYSNIVGLPIEKVDKEIKKISKKKN